MRLILLLLLLSTNANAETIKIGVDESPPFSFQYKASNDRWHGISVDLFNEIAINNNWDVEYTQIPFSNFEEALQNGTIDVYIPAVTLTAEREERLDFSYTYYKDNLGISGPRQENFISFVKELINKLFPVIKFVPASILICALLYTIIEHKKVNGYNIFNSIYWAITTAVTVGYGDEAPKTVLGRILAIAWMISGILTFSWMFGILLNLEIEDQIDTTKINLVVEENTTAHQYVKENNLQFETVKNTKQLDDAIADNKYILSDASLIPNAIILENTEQYYAFAFREESPLIEETNQQLLKILNSQLWERIKNAYL